MADVTRRLVTEFVIKGEKAAEVINKIMKALDKMRGLADQDLLARALSAPSAISQIQAINTLLEDFQKKYARMLVKGGEGPGRAASMAKDKVVELREEFKRTIPEAEKVLRPKGYSTLALNIGKATKSLTQFRTQLTGPIKEGSDVVRKLTKHISELTDYATRLSALPFVSPATKENIQATLVAAVRMRDALEEIKSFGKMDFFGAQAGKYKISNVDVGNADKLLSRMRSTSTYWKDNAATVDKMYKKAADGDEKSISSLHKKAGLYNGMANAAQKFYTAAQKGDLPQGYVERFRTVLDLFGQTDGALAKIKNSTKEFVHTITDSRMQATFSGVLQSVKEVSAELSAGRLQESAKRYGSALDSSIKNAVSRQYILRNVTKEYWDEARANLDRWHQEYINAITDIATKQETFRLSGMDTPKQKEIIGKEQLRTARTYMFNLIKEKNALQGVIKQHKSYIKELRNNVKAGKENSTNLARAQTLLKEYKATLATVQSRLRGVSSTAKKAYSQLKEGLQGGAKTFRGLSQDVKDFSYYMDVAIQKIIRYRVAFTVMHEIVRFFKSTMTVPKQIEHQFAQLKKVMNEATTDFEALRRAAFGFAIDFGVSLKEVTDIMFIWAQQGKTQNEIIQLTQASVLGMTAANLTAKEAVEALTAAIKQFDIAAEDSYVVMDKLLNVQRNFAVTAQDLADSVKLLGATARQMGMDINELFGTVTAVAEVTRKSGKAVANSLKTVFARIVKKEALSSLQKVGIAVYDLEGQLRPLGTILDSIAEKWNAMTKSQKLHIAHVVGGIRRYNDFLVLMDNYGASMAATVIALNSTGEAHKAALIEQETFHRSLESAKIGFQRYTEAVGSTAIGFFQLGHAIKGLSSTLVDDSGKLTEFGKVATNLVSGLGTLIAVLFTAKGIAFTFGLIMTVLTKAAFAQVIAGTELTVANQAVSESAIRAGLATEYNWFQQARLFAGLVATGKATAMVTGEQIGLTYAMSAAGKSTAPAIVGLYTFATAEAATTVTTGILTGALHILKVTVLGLGRAFGWWGLGIAVASVFLAKHLVGLGKSKAALEEIEVSTKIQAFEQAKLLKIYSKSTKAIALHVANMYQLRKGMTEAGKVTIKLGDAFNSQIQSISNLSMVFGEKPLLPSFFPEDANKQLEEASKRINEIYGVIIKTTAAMEKARTATMKNIRSAIEDLSRSISGRRLFLGALAQTTSAAYDMRDALADVLNTMNRIDDNATRAAALDLFKELALDLLGAKDNADELKTTLARAFSGPEFKRTFDALIATYENYWAEHGKAGAQAFAGGFDKEFTELTSKSIDHMLKTSDEKFQSFLEKINFDAAKMSMIRSEAYSAVAGEPSGMIKGPGAKGIPISAIGDELRIIAEVYNALSGSMIGYTQAESDNAATLSESIKKKTQLTEALVDAVQAYGILSYGVEQYKTMVKESISAMSKATSVLRSYGVVLGDADKTTYQLVKDETQLAAATGNMTSAFDRHLNALKKGVKMAYDAYILQKAKLVEQENEIDNQDKLQKAVLQMHEIVAGGVRSYIISLEKLRSKVDKTMTPEKQKEYVAGLTVQIDELNKALKAIKAGDLEAIYKLADEDRAGLMKSLTKTFRENLGMSKKDAELAVKKFNADLSAKGLLELRIKLAEQLMETRKEEYETILRATAAEAIRVTEEKKAFKEHFRNMKDKQTFVLNYYKNLEKMSSKLSDSYYGQQLSISETTLDLEHQLAVTKAVEKVIETFVNTTGKAAEEFSEVKELTGETLQSLQKLAKEQGVYKDLTDDAALFAKKEIDALTEQLKLKKNLSRLAKAQSLVEKTITDAYKIRSDINKKYYSELESLQSAAGANEKKLIQIRINALDNELALTKELNKDRSKAIDLMDTLTDESVKQERLLGSAGDTMKEKAVLAEKSWLQIQQRLVDVYRTLKDVASITDNITGLISSTLVDASQEYMQNIERAKDIEQEMADLTSEIAELQRDYAQATDPQQQASMAFELEQARNSYKDMNEEADKLRSVMYNLGELAANFAQSLADIVIEINQEQLKSALQEIIVGSPFEKRMAETLSGGLIQASTFGSEEYYTKLIDAGKIAADNMYLKIIQAIHDAAPTIGEAIRQASIELYASSTGAGDFGGIVGPIGTQPIPTFIGGKGTSSAKGLNVAMGMLNTSVQILNETLTQTNVALALNAGVIKDSTGVAKDPPSPPPDPGMDAATRAFNAIAGQVGMLIGTMAGGGGRGASIGSALGGAATGAAFGPWGGLLGGVAGGILGGLFDKDEKPIPPPISPMDESIIDSNTEATDANTYSMNKLSIAVNDIKEEMINAPGRFVIPPQYYGGGMTSQGGFSLSINVAGSLDSLTARQLTDDINDIYSNQYRRQGYSTRIT